MIEWREEGALLTVRRHGETTAIIELFTRDHGRATGVVRGGGGRRMAPILQPGAQLDATWKARLDEHLGHFTIEPLRSRAEARLSGRVALEGLNSVTALLSFALPERAPHPTLYDHSMAVLDLLGQQNVWPLAYLLWEKALLEELGFGLDLSECAATGMTQELIYISPRSGRAVSRAGAGIWADRLLPLSPALVGAEGITQTDIIDGLHATGHFLEHHLAPSLGDRPLPAARSRLIALIARDI